MSASERLQQSECRQFRDHPQGDAHHPTCPAEDQDRGDHPDSKREPYHHLREVWLQHSESQRAGAEPLHQGYSKRPFGTVAVTEREGADKAHHEAEGGVEKREERTGNRPQRKRDCATL